MLGDRLSDLPISIAYALLCIGAPFLFVSCMIKVLTSEIYIVYKALIILLMLFLFCGFVYVYFEFNDYLKQIMDWDKGGS